MSIIFLFWLHVIKPMIQTANEVDAELQLIDQCVSYNGDFMNLRVSQSETLKFYESERQRMAPEDFIY